MLTGILISNVGVMLTLALGVVAILFPRYIQAFVSISAIGKEGESEVRATYGGFFAGIAVYALFSQSVEVFLTIGLGWLAASAIRLLTLFKGSHSLKNIGGVAFEAAIGTLCSASAII
ncbi:MAG: hypothetical protein ACI84K_001839 [Pseudohongiellaceae bacterium]|jgi:hypothetical protein